MAGGGWGRGGTGQEGVARKDCDNVDRTSADARNGEGSGIKQASKGRGAAGKDEGRGELPK